MLALFLRAMMTPQNEPLPVSESPSERLAKRLSEQLSSPLLTRRGSSGQKRAKLASSRLGQTVVTLTSPTEGLRSSQRLRNLKQHITFEDDDA